MEHTAEIGFLSYLFCLFVCLEDFSEFLSSFRLFVPRRNFRVASESINILTYSAQIFPFLWWTTLVTKFTNFNSCRSTYSVTKPADEPYATGSQLLSEIIFSVKWTLRTLFPFAVGRLEVGGNYSIENVSMERYRFNARCSLLYPCLYRESKLKPNRNRMMDVF